MKRNRLLNYFMRHQTEWIRDNARTAMSEKSRRAGITHADAYRSVDRRLRLGTDHYVGSRDAESAKLYIEDVKLFAEMADVVADDMGEQLIDERRQITARVVRIKVPERAREGKIMALTSNPDVFRGKGGDITLDEFAFHPWPRRVLKAANASAKIWGHQVRIISSHNGESNLFNQLITEIRSGKRKWSLHRVTLQDAVNNGLVEKVRGIKVATAAERQAFLDEVREDCVDQAEWDEEYCCIPSSEANALLSYDLIGACERSSDRLPVTDDPAMVKFNGQLFAGVDIGRQRDLTVFWVLAKIGDVYETRLIKTFQATPWHIQEEYLHLLMSTLNISRMCIDATGIGNMLAEYGQRRWGSYRVEKVTFTNEVKSDLALPLVRLFQDRLVRVPADPEVREDLHRVRKIVTSANNVRFDAKSDEAGHADRFWALGLAYHAADRQSILPAPLATVPEEFW